MALLLSLAQQQEIKPISSNNTDKYQLLASEVEELELKKLLGVALLQDLQTNPTAANNLILLNGGTFTQSGVSVKHKGIRYVTAYLNISKYIGESYVNDTFTGFTKKKREESDSLNEGEIKRLQNLNREIALSEFELIRCFLDQNNTTYNLWICANTQKVYSPKIYGVRKTYR